MGGGRDMDMWEDDGQDVYFPYDYDDGYNYSSEWDDDVDYMLKGSSYKSFSYQPQKKYVYVGIRYKGYNKIYHFICDDWTVKIGDVVKVSSLDGFVNVKVITRGTYSEGNAPYPPTFTKHVESIVSRAEKKSHKNTIIITIISVIRYIAGLLILLIGLSGIIFSHDYLLALSFACTGLSLLPCLYHRIHNEENRIILQIAIPIAFLFIFLLVGCI